MTRTPLQIVEDFVAAFVAAWPEGDASRLAPFFSTDAIYHNIPLAPVAGRDAIVATLAGFMAMGGEVRVDLMHVAVDGPIVMTEPVDHFVGATGTTSLPVMGIFEIRDETIDAWRDYFDLSQFTDPGSPADRPVLDQINLVVSGMDAAVAFYRRLGLTIPDVDADFQAHHRSAERSGAIQLDLDSQTFARHWDNGWSGGTGVIGFKVATRETVDELYANLIGAGYRGQQTPYDAFWGVRYAVVEDPDGNAVGIMSPRDPARNRPPGFP
jgi:limonene-1,2-epoxide hydrolase